MVKTIKEKKLISITTRVKTFSHPYINYMANKDYKQTDNFIPRTTFWKCLFPCQNAFEKCITKTKLFNGKRYVKKLYTRL